MYRGTVRDTDMHLINQALITAEHTSEGRHNAPQFMQSLDQLQKTFRLVVCDRLSGLQAAIMIFASTNLGLSFVTPNFC